jgi:SSS family solute:Na+ symporter
VLGMVKLTLQTFYGSGEGRIHEPAFLAAIGDFNPYYATGVLLLISAAIIIVASLSTPPPPEEKTRGLTWGSVHHDPATVAEIKASWDTGNKVMSAVILLCVLGMYTYFTFWLN